MQGNGLIIVLCESSAHSAALREDKKRSECTATQLCTFGCEKSEEKLEKKWVNIW